MVCWGDSITPEWIRWIRLETSNPKPARIPQPIPYANVFPTAGCSRRHPHPQVKHPAMRLCILPCPTFNDTKETPCLHLHLRPPLRDTSIGAPSLHLPVDCCVAPIHLKGCSCCFFSCPTIFASYMAELVFKVTVVLRHSSSLLSSLILRLRLRSLLPNLVASAWKSIIGSGMRWMASSSCNKASTFTTRI